MHLVYNNSNNNDQYVQSSLRLLHKLPIHIYIVEKLNTGVFLEDNVQQLQSVSVVRKAPVNTKIQGTYNVRAKHSWPVDFNINRHLFGSLKTRGGQPYW